MFIKMTHFRVGKDQHFCPKLVFRRQVLGHESREGCTYTTYDLKTYMIIHSSTVVLQNGPMLDITESWTHSNYSVNAVQLTKHTNVTAIMRCSNLRSVMVSTFNHLNVKAPLLRFSSVS